MKQNLLRLLIALLCAAVLLAGCTKPEPPADSTADLPSDSTPAQTEANTAAPPDVDPGEPSSADDFRFAENSDGTLTLTGYTGTESILDIPAGLNGKPVSAIGESCFAGLICLKSVHIPEGVTQIGDYAFESCTALQKVYFPYSLRSIGDGAFSGCETLTLADMQEGLESIGRGAFLYCVSLV